MSNTLEQDNKLEQIKKLQDDLFIEEYGVTQKQAKKINEFIFHEPTGKGFDTFWGCETIKPSVSERFSILTQRLESQDERLAELEAKHLKLCLGTWAFAIITITGLVAYVLSN